MVILIWVFITLVFSNCLPCVSSWWHLYNDHHSIPDTCPRSKIRNTANPLSSAEDFSRWSEQHVGQREYTSPLSAEDISRWKLWPTLISSIDRQAGEVMYGFKAGMELIWKNQHPADCKNAKFLISNGWDQGFGSEVHVLGEGLALAINMGRVFVLNPNDTYTQDGKRKKWQFQNPFCAAQNKFSSECYFEPWTSCSHDDIFQGLERVHDLKKLGVTYFSDTDIVQKGLWDLEPRLLLLESRGDVPNAYPKQFEDLYRCAPVASHFFFYFWRVYSAAYLLRPNEATRKFIADHRTLPFDPEKERCISVYVRRGDKHVEMELVPIHEYLSAATALWRHGLAGQFDDAVPSGSGTGALNASSSHPVMFIGSEDASVIDKVLRWGKEHNWKIIFTDLFDRRSVSAGLSFSKQVELKEVEMDKHHDHEYLSMLLNLDYHMQCSAFVCTMRSNFCRVIDELRASVAFKANRFYTDLTSREPEPKPNMGFDLGW